MATTTPAIRPNLHAPRHGPASASLRAEGQQHTNGLLAGVEVAPHPAGAGWKKTICPAESHERLKKSDMIEENGAFCCPTCGLELAPVLVVEELEGRQNVSPLYWLNGYRGSPDSYVITRPDEDNDSVLGQSI